MTCQDMEARIAEFLAGELSDRSEVEEHLLACAECRAKFSIARSGWQAADEWKAAGPSGDAIASTLAAMGPRDPRKLVRVLQVGTLAATLLIVFALATSRPAREVPESRQATAAAAPASTGLASLRPSVGLLFVRDENGRPAGELSISRLNVRVDIRDGIARTEIEEIFQNRTDMRLEGTFQFPLPPDASISRLAMEIDGKLMEGEVVEREKARQTYEGIVRSMKDPALLEWMPGGLFQCRIFPIEPRSDKRIVIAYTQALSVFDGRGRYVYPLSGESARELGIGRFEIAAMVRAGSKIVSAGSTSHEAATIRLDDRTMRTTFAHSDFRPRADFVLAFETEARGEIQVAAHRPEGAEPGYFAAFLTPRAEPEEDLRRNRRIYFLLDASGSVARAELEAARTVVRRMVETLKPDDRFRIGCHNLFVGTMLEFVAPDEAGKRAADRYLAEIAPAGAGDFANALEIVLSYVPDNGELVYVGEGTPTWGEKDPAKIVARIREAIGTRRISIRTVAVGSDAERGLLETVSREFNGGAHAISPSDDVNARAGEIARTLGRSALSDLKIEFKGAVTDAAPASPGSLHFGERLLVTGRYGAGPVTLTLKGRVHDRVIQREFTLTLPEREAGNLHVKRLWAQRRLADLVAQGDAKRAEAVKLSVEHQVMTPYTSFLVLENEKAYEQHRIDRTKKDADQTNDPRIADARRLFQEALADYRQKRFDQVLAKCDRILAIDPKHPLAAEVKEQAQKSRHRESYAQPELENWSRGLSAKQPSESVRAEVQRKLDQRRELELLFSQAQVHFGREEYDKCVDLCDRILFIDPRLSSVDEMKMIAQRLKHVKSDRELTRTYIEQWKRIFENIENTGFVTNDDLSFPAREMWLEMIRRRKPKGILRADEELTTEATSEQEWDELHRKLVGKSRLDEQQKAARAEEHYRLALRHYDSGDFEKADAESMKALSLNPTHGASHALQLETRFALGKGRTTPQSQEFESIIHMAHARQQQVIFEVRDAMDSGIRDYNLGKYSDAERHFRTIIEYAKWLPEAPELDAQRRQAAEMLGKLQHASPSGLQSPADGGTGRSNMGYSVMSQPGQQFATFLDPDGGGGPLAVSSPGITGTLGRLVEEPVEQTANGGLAFSIGEGRERPGRGPGSPAQKPYDPSAPFLGDIPDLDALFRRSRQAPYIQDYEIQVATAAAAAEPIPRVWGINQSVSIPGLDDLSVDFINRPPVGGYDIGGVGFTDIDERADGPAAAGNTVLRQMEARLERNREALENAQRALEQNTPRAERTRSSTSPNVQNQPLEAERLAGGIKELAESYEALARERQRLQETIAHLNGSGARSDVVMPRKGLTGAVTAVASELDLVVISIGRDAGVNEGDEFTLLRGKTLVGKMVIDRVDRQWASGRIALKSNEEPRIGDQASNNVLTPVPPPMRIAAVTGDEVSLSDIDLNLVAVDRIIVLLREGHYVAAVRVHEIQGRTAKARAIRGLRAAEIRLGDVAIVVGSIAELWTLVPLSIQLDLDSHRDLAAARLKLIMLRAMKGVMP